MKDWTAEAVKDLRLRHRWSMEEMAAHVGVSKQMIWAYEHAVNRPTRYAILRELDRLDENGAQP